MKLSIIVPCFNEEACVRDFWQAVRALNLPCEHEFWFVDDGSRDRTLAICRELAAEDPAVHYISFSRNFGKEAALLAGLRHATGDLVATMDADLQDPPALLPEMIRLIQEEHCESVATRRGTRRGEPRLRSWFARRFYWLMDSFSDVHLQEGSRDFRLMTRTFVNAVLSLTEVNRFTKGIYSWVGYDTRWLTFDNVERQAGQTKWSFWGLCRYSFEGISAFSTAPLQMASFLGIFSCLTAFVYILVIVAKTFICGETVKGYPTLICIILLLGGLQLLCMGTLGFYLAKLYREVKRRPVYLIKEEH